MQTKTMKTKAGTELPLLNLKGKDYLQVMHRLVWFREEHPDWSITTKIVERSAEFVVFQAVISKEQTAFAVAHKREDAKHFPDFLEKAETGAIGRALAMCGYGTQFAPELDEEDRIVDSPVPARTPSTAASQMVPQGQRRPIGPPPGAGVRPTTPPSAKVGPTATKTASPSKAPPQGTFDEFPGGPVGR